MRVEICYENAIQYQWFIVEGAIEFPDKVPLTWTYNFDRPPLGHVTDIRREDDGGITGEMVFVKDEYKENVELLLKNNDVEASMYANEVTDERCEDLRIVYKAALKAVVIVMNAAFPKIPEEVIPNG